MSIPLYILDELVLNRPLWKCFQQNPQAMIVSSMFGFFYFVGYVEQREYKKFGIFFGATLCFDAWRNPGMRNRKHRFFYLFSQSLLGSILYNELVKSFHKDDKMNLVQDIVLSALSMFVVWREYNNEVDQFV
jgi:hypothetical protein